MVVSENCSLPDRDLCDGIVTSEIKHFYNGRSVFITGASGFVGTVILETLLRCCPDMEKVYILLREKKGVQPKDRIQPILHKKIFTNLSCSDAEFKKIHVVEGDVTLDGLGISSEQMLELEKNVSVVFHCAAVISFFKNFRVILQTNLIGTDNVIQFCRRLPKLAALVHCSTAYSNSNIIDKIEEKVYEVAVPPKLFIEAAKKGDEDELQGLYDKCTPLWPNAYTLSKALAENLLATEAKDLPVVILRPSIIICIWKGPLPGYIEPGGGIIDMSVGVGKGFIRVVYLRKNSTTDLVPVDIVANTMITSSWFIGTRKIHSPFVVNCTTSHNSRMSYEDTARLLFDITKEYPLPKMYQTPIFMVRYHRLTYWASAVVNHYAPAACIDAFLFMMGKKPLLTKMYKFYDKVASKLSYFIENEWKFDCENLGTLISAQNLQDSQDFPINTENINLKEICYALVTGCPFFDWKVDKRSVKERLSIAQKRYMLTEFIKWMAVIWICSFLLLIFMKAARC